MDKNIETLKKLVQSEDYVVNYNGWLVLRANDECIEIDRGDWEQNRYYTDKDFSWENFSVYLKQTSPFTV
jgi:hypothetical protein